MAGYKEAVPIAVRLQDRRKARGITQAQAGLEVGVDQGTFNKWVRGRQFPNSENMAAVASFLETTEDDVAASVQAGRRQLDLGERVSAVEERLDRVEAKLDLLIEER